MDPNDDRLSGWRAWVVLGVVFAAFLVVPWGLIALPAMRGVVGAVGFSFRDAYLVVPLIPAVLLGVVGVWTALRSGRRR